MDVLIWIQTRPRCPCRSTVYAPEAKAPPHSEWGGGAILLKLDLDNIQKTGWSRFVQEIYQWSQLTSNGYESVILQMSEFLNTTTQDKYLFQTDSADGKIVMTI